MSLIPEKLNNFAIYGGPTSIMQLGVASLELPTLEAMTEEISGAGIAGSIASVVPGHFGSMSLKVKWRTVTTQKIALIAPVRQTLDCRGSLGHQDSQLGTAPTVAMRVSCSGMVKSSNLGNFEPGKAMGAETDLEVYTLRVSMAGILVLELDKLNQIFRVNGVDYLAQQRADTGGV